MEGQMLSPGVGPFVWRNKKNVGRIVATQRIHHGIVGVDVPRNVGAGAPVGASHENVFHLVGAQAGMAIGSASGVFTWTPTEAKDGAHTVTVRVTDNGTPAKSDEETITITVDEVNVAPTAVDDDIYSVDEGGTLTSSTSVAANRSYR